MNAKPARWLSMSVVALVTAASVAGLWMDGLYREPDALVQMLRAFDLVTLGVVAPLLALTLVPRFRHHPRAELLTPSMLAYCVYNYAYYIFGAELNALLLVQVAIFTTAIYALVLWFMRLDVPSLGSRFQPKTPVRAIAAILLLLGVPLAIIQLGTGLSFAMSGTVPEDPSVLVVPAELTRLGAVLDLSLLVPAYVLAAVLLWRRRAWGFVLATIVLVSGALHQVGYYAAMIFQNRAGIPGAAYDPFEPVILGLFVVAAALLLANMSAPGGLRRPPGDLDPTVGRGSQPHVVSKQYGAS